MHSTKMKILRWLIGLTRLDKESNSNVRCVDFAHRIDTIQNFGNFMKIELV